MKIDNLNEIFAASAVRAMNDIAAVTEWFPERKSASESEKGAANYFKERLEAVSDETKEEEFSVAPVAAFGWIYFTIICAIMSYVTYFFVAFLSVVFIILAVIPCVIQGFLQLPYFDSAYVSRKSQNITATKKCSGETKKRIILVAHVDSAPIMPLKNLLGAKGMAVVTGVSALSLIYLLACNIAHWVYLGSMGSGIVTDGYLYAGLVGIIFVPIWISCFFMFGTKKVSSGAADNLSGCFVALSILETMQNQDIVLDNTEIQVVITGAEECGMRGSAAWCEAHKEESKENTIVIVLDTFREPNKFGLNCRELYGAVAMDKVLVEEVATIAEGIGISCEKRKCAYGATDATTFRRAGYRAVALTASSPLAEYIHSESDVAFNLNPQALLDAMRIVAEVISKTDEK